MAAIFGVCHFDDRPIDRALTERMSGALAHRGEASAIAIDGAVALGRRWPHGTSAGRQPERGAPGVRVAFEGRLDDREALIDTLRAHADASDAELAAAAYEAAGAGFARALVGDFSVAIFDSRERRLVLARDAIGIRPLYYRRTASAVYFASEAKALFADPDFQVAPNAPLLAELMLRRTHRREADGSTLFAGILQVPPAHVALFSAAGARVERYWDFDARPTPLSFDECADGFRHHFRRAVERRVRGAQPVAIAVSGGLDSSAIFCAAHEVAPRTPLVGLTYTTRDGGPADESAYVASVERACGRPIQYVDAPFGGLLFQSGEIIHAAEAPMLNGQWFRGDALMRAVRAHGATTLLTGHWGDQLLFDQAYLVDLLSQGAWDTIVAHLREYPRWFPDATRGEFARQFVADLLEYQLPRWVRTARRAARRVWHRPAAWDDWFTARFLREARPDVFPAFPDKARRPAALARALYREVRSQYHHLCLEWNAKVGARYGVEPAFPFFDRDLVQFLIGVPGTTATRGGVPKALLRRSLRGVVPDMVLERRTKSDFTADVNRATSRDLASVEAILGPNSAVVQLGYVDADKLKRGLAAGGAALGGTRSSTVSWRLARLVALELWLQRFVTRQTTTEEELAWQENSP